MSVSCLISSKNTRFYVISTPEDKAGELVNTKNGKDGIPEHPGIMLLMTPGIDGDVTVATISNPASHLFISLNGTANKTKLTWSNERYLWVIRQTGSKSYVITPDNGADLYWFDEFNVGVGDHVEVRAGRDIQPPQNEWVIARIIPG